MSSIRQMTSSPRRLTAYVGPRRFVAVMFALLVGLVALPGVASAAWRAPADLGASIDDTAPQVVVDGSGNATSVWVQTNADWSYALVARRRPAGGTWGPPQTLVQDTGYATLRDGVQLVVDGGGNVTVAYRRNSTTSSNRAVMLTATAPPGAPFGAPQYVTPESGEGFACAESPGVPDLAVAPDGSLVVAWAHRHQCGLDADNSTSFVRAARRAPGQPWGAIDSLSPLEGSADHVRAAMTPQGEAAVMWAQRCDTATDCKHSLVSRTMPVGGAWSATSTIALVTGDYGGAGRLVSDAAGNLTAAWTSDSSIYGLRLDAARRPASGGWGTPSTLAADKVDADVRPDPGPELAVAADGTVAVLWHGLASDFLGYKPLVARRTATGWQPAEDATGGAPPERGGDGSLAGDADGDLVVTWTTHAYGDPSRFTVQAARRSAGGEFTTPEVVAESAVQSFVRTAVAMGPGDDAVAVWDAAERLDFATEPRGPRVSEMLAETASPGDTTEDTSSGGDKSGGGQTVSTGPTSGGTPQTGSNPAPSGATGFAREQIRWAEKTADSIVNSKLFDRFEFFPKARKATSVAVKASSPKTDVAVAVLAPLSGSRLVSATPAKIASAYSSSLLAAHGGALARSYAGGIVADARGRLLSTYGSGLSGATARGANVGTAATSSSSTARAHAAAAPKLRALSKGARFFAQPGSGKLKVKLTAQGRKALRRSLGKRGKQRVRVVLAVTVGQRGSGAPAVTFLRQTTVRG